MHRLAADGHSLAEVLERVADAIDARVAVIDQNAFELVSAGAARRGTARTALRLPSGKSEQFRLAVEGIGSNDCAEPVLGPVAAVHRPCSSAIPSEHIRPCIPGKPRAFMEALYEDRGEPSAPLRRYALELGFDPDSDFGCGA